MLSQHSCLFYFIPAEHFSLCLQIKVEEDEEEGLVCVEVQIESSSVAPVCGLHHAVLRRVQVHTHTHTVKQDVFRTASSRVKSPSFLNVSSRKMQHVSVLPTKTHMN